MQALLLVAEHDGPTMLARIGVMRALNVREFTSRKDHHWGPRKLKKGPMTKRRNCSARHTDSGDTSKRFSRGQSRDRDNSAPASRCSIILAELVSPPARGSAGPARFSSGLLARRAALFPVPADAFTAARRCQAGLAVEEAMNCAAPPMG
jgi:hypothetical protein